MRLTCPNCDATYEVPDDVIPESGRDVQCSNCGHTWFEGPRVAAGRVTPRRAAPEPTPSAPQSEPEPVRRTAEVPSDDADPDQRDDDEGSGEGGPSGRRELDPQIADILRQEAEYERRARQKSEAEPLQSQPDLGLDAAQPAPADRHAEESRRRVARLKGEEAPKPGEHVTGASRERLPDIEEINSTLRSSRERRERPEDTAQTYSPRRASGYRLGFALTLLIFAAGLLAFVFAPQISAKVPQIAPYLERYVAEVDVARLWLDQQIQTVIKLIPSGE